MASEQLPVIRDDIELVDAGFNEHGQPKWLLYDGARDQYFQIGWLEFEILTHWHLASIERIVAAINAKTTLQVNPSEVFSFIEFMQNNQLTVTSDNLALERLLSIEQQSSELPWRVKITQYLFFRIRLWNPDKFLNATLPYVKPLFSKLSGYIFLLLLFVALYILITSWNEFVSTLLGYLNVTGLLYLFAGLLVTKVLHELGHAYVAKYYGCKVTTIGVAILLLWPVLYTDTTYAWRLRQHTQRLLVSSAGIITELGVAVIATLLWGMLPDGHFKNICFFLAFVSWGISLLINLNPFMRFDGYYVLSDLIGIKNLEQQSFTLAKYYIGKYCFGIAGERPFYYDTKKAKWLTLYAIGTWLYRFFLFMGIAYIIYSFLFKFLGLIIAGITLYNFIIYPILNTLATYKKDNSLWSFFKKKPVVIVLVLVCVLLFFPWQVTIKAPGVMQGERVHAFYSPADGYIESSQIAEQKRLNKNALLMQLSSPDIDNDLNLVDIKIHLMKRKLTTQKYQSENLGYKQSDEEELAKLFAERSGLVKQQQKLVLKAPFQGEIVDIEKGLKKRVWVSRDDYLFSMVSNQKYLIEAYVSQQDIKRIQENAAAEVFIEDHNKKIQAKLIQIEKIDMSELSKPYQSSEYGGDIPTLRSKNKKLVPQQSFFRVILALTHSEVKISKIEPVTVYIQGTRQSIAGRFIANLYLTLLQHSQF